MPNEIDRKTHTNQECCYICGKRFVRVKYECPICGEWQCSEECRNKHIEAMDNI
jgi:hypothetical protein